MRPEGYIFEVLDQASGFVNGPLVIDVVFVEMNLRGMDYRIRNPSQEMDLQYGYIVVLVNEWYPVRYFSNEIKITI